jgi:hypothetical protein
LGTQGGPHAPQSIECPHPSVTTPQRPSQVRGLQQPPPMFPQVITFVPFTQ